MVTGLKDRWLWGPEKRIATNWKIRGSIPGRKKIFSLLRTVQTGPVAHQASRKMGNKGFPGGKPVEEWRWQPSTI
jgi:hypothetical protein